MEKREIIFDTETTGLDSVLDRVTEIGALEMVNGVLTGNYYHAFVNPDRPIPKRVTEITGLTNDFLAPMRLFKDVGESFVDFVGQDKLVAHNADFDRKFINAELKRNNLEEIPDENFIDTLQIAREVHVGKRNTLDALASRYGIENKDRDVHSALIDCILLAQVYQCLNKEDLGTILQKSSDLKPLESHTHQTAPMRPKKLTSLLTDSERRLHKTFIESIAEKSDKTPQWARIFRQQEKNMKIGLDF